MPLMFLLPSFSTKEFFNCLPDIKCKSLQRIENKKQLSPEEQNEIVNTLKIRFEKNMNRHAGNEWVKVQAKLENAVSGKLWSLSEMERTDGEPDVVDFEEKTGEFLFFDCSAESPKGRRSVCYDQTALESRKESELTASPS